MEFTGKTVADAIDTALQTLNLTEEQIEVNVISQPTRGLFGRLKGQAVIDVQKKKEETKDTEKVIEKPIKKEKSKKEKKEDDVDSNLTVAFVQKLVDLLSLDATAKLESVGDETVIRLDAENSSSLIGYRGEVLDAIQTLAGAKENSGRKNYKKVIVDCENYRGKREDTLVKLAHRLEEKATEIRREVILEPMKPFERRIIHTALADSKTVTTTSDGKEPNRYVIIVPNDKDEFSKPYNAGRFNDGRKNNKRSGNGKGFDRKGNRGGKRGGSGFISSPKKTSSGFGTYLGNSLKDNK